MELSLKVKAGAKQDRVTATGPKSLDVTLKAPAQDGKANAALIRLLARHFGVTQAQITIKRGKTSKNKFIEVTS